MSQSPRQMHLGAFLFGVGHHLAAWRHPDVDPAGAASLAHYQRLARLAEAAKFDAIFCADNVGLSDAPAHLLARNALPYMLEPLQLLTALAGATERIGLVATVSTSYLPPYHLARKFATLDRLSEGRSGWNLVTSGSDFEARNFGLNQQADHASRYQRAQEYVKVAQGLWDSWEDDAFRFDAQAGQFFDPAKLHRVRHEGTHYSVHGALQTPRPIQGYPVMVQAGSSEDGQNLAAETAELVFTAQQTVEEARAFYQGLRACLRSPTGRAAVFSGWDARRGAPSIARLSTSAATPQTARKDHCPKGWSEIGRLGAPAACMGTSPCGASGPPTHPDCAPTRPVRDRKQALKARLPAFGRPPDALKILPGVSAFVGRSEAEAQDKYEALQSLIDPAQGLGLLSAFLGGVDLSGYPLDGPLPELPRTEGWQSRQDLFSAMARRENLSLRQLYQKVIAARGHWTLAGTPVQIADQLEHWFQTGAADGFNVMGPTLPHGLSDFIELVLPELRRRSLFRTDYTGRTLREHLGLPRPAHPAALARQATRSATSPTSVSHAEASPA